MQFLDVGETRRLTFTFTAFATGESTAPTTATLAIRDPDGTTTNPAPVHDGTDGDYHYDLDPNKAGWWTYTWAGQGNGVDQTESFDLLVGLAPAQAGPCAPWTTWDEVQEATTIPLGTIDEDEREEILDFATAILYGETGKRYPGLCRRTFSICDCGAWCGSYGYPFGNPAAADWQGWSYGSWGGACFWRHCTGKADHIDLGELRFPVVAARDVTVAGTVVPTSSWRIDDRRYLVRTDGSTWPECADLTDPSQFKATLLYGRQPFAGGDQACAALAAEMGKFRVEGTCNLPENVTDIIRAGITYRVRDSKDLLDDGLSGVPTTDRWLAAEKFSRVGPPGGTDPARDPRLLRLGTDRGGDR